MSDAADAVARFERSTLSFLDALDGVSEEAWRVRPAGEMWSLAETVEHVVLTDRAIRARLEQLLAARLLPGAPRFDDAAISARMFDGAGPAPPGLAEPSGRFATRAEGIAALLEVRDQLVRWARETPADLRSHGLPHPVFGVFDGVQWILFAAAHTENHLPQLRALRANAETPVAAQETEAIASALFAAIARGDLDAVRELYSPDVEIWHNVTGKAQTREENLSLLRYFTGRVSELRYEVLARELFEGGFVQRHVLHGKLESGELIAAPVCLVVYVSRGNITRLFEYLDPASVRAAFT